MTLTAGTRLGPFEILEPLGAGGMGEVYRGRDTRLGRDVALKVLPEAFTLDTDRRARFEREARVLGSLNHPNIATLYGIESFPTRQLLVMELVEGETLADRLARRAAGTGLAVREVLLIAQQVASALETAHDHGIVHRDLKPANVAVRSDGTVKVLDFGLAKPLELSESSDGPTVTATEAGEARGIGPGTPAYMSPEQARGLRTDKRTDIWALGCVVFELLSGRRPFQGERTSDVLAKILEREPDFEVLPPETPAAVRRLVRRCLQKDVRKRLRDIGDARLELEEALSEPPGAPGASSRRTHLWSWTVVLGLTTLLLLGLLYGRSPTTDRAPLRFSILPPDRGVFLTPILSGAAAPVGGTVSPDGRTLAFTASDATGKVSLWIRRLDALEATSFAGTDQAALPFWSPDSRSLGFFAASRLKRVDVADGTVQVLCDVIRGRGGSWNRDGVIVFASSDARGLSRIDAAGGAPQPLTTLEPGQLAHRFPSFLPDGRRFLYYAEGSNSGDTGVFAGHLDGGRGRRVLTADSAAVYAQGQILFVRQGTLFARPFHPARLDTSGDSVPLATSVPSEGGSPAFSASETGVLTYRSGAEKEQQFGWFDREGHLLALVGPPGNYRGVDLSPDGQRIAVHRHDGDGGDVWVIEPRGTATRVTFDPAQDNLSPIWSPDGTRIAFASLRSGKWGLYQKQADRTEEDGLLTESEFPKLPSAWSPDGRSLVYWLYNAPPSFIDLWLVPVAGEMRPRALIGTRFYEGHAQISPDGRWIAYVSNQAGALQVYVRPFPSGDRVWTVSTGSGVTPRWGENGKELFYVTSYDNGTLMSVPVRTEGDTFVPGTPRELFSTGIVTPPHSTTIAPYHMYAVDPAGQRFLLPQPVSALRRDPASTAITVVVDWPALLERRAGR